MSRFAAASRPCQAPEQGQDRGCLVLGGGGFIGSAVCARLLQHGFRVRILERPGVSFQRAFEPHEAIEWRSGDLSCEQDLLEALEGMEVVLHLASGTTPGHSHQDPIQAVQRSLVPTLRMLETLRSRRVSRIIFISSGGTVYGKPRYLPMDEAHPTEPLVPYGITMLAVEKYLLMHQQLHGLRVVILRVGNAYGEGQWGDQGQGVVGAFLHRALTGRSVEVWGDGRTRKDFIHVADVAEAFARAITYSGPESVFNIGSGVSTSLTELLGLIEGELGMAIPKLYRPRRPFDVPDGSLACGLAQLELGWAPAIGLRAGITRTIAWMRAALEGGLKLREG